jgi:hypothetical protein
MSNGFSNRPKILRGAFVEFGISVPPLLVPFQFNPAQITRSRKTEITPPKTKDAQRPGFFCPREVGAKGPLGLGRAVLKNRSALAKIRPKSQEMVVGMETITFDIRLDATDGLNDGHHLTELFGVAPRLATLELMMLPKEQTTFASELLITNVRKVFSFVDDIGIRR